MKNETIDVLRKNKIENNVKSETTSSTGCCGGAPKNNEEACCKLDEEKKEEGLEGCGCGTTTDNSKKTSCC